uniref:Uncharacterized protein n=1 Tax=Cyprinodon variegatus TaxID=28743 RepID=A0A3Q2CN72_CYPVA
MLLAVLCNIINLINQSNSSAPSPGGLGSAGKVVVCSGALTSSLQEPCSPILCSPSPMLPLTCPLYHSSQRNTLKDLIKILAEASKKLSLFTVKHFFYYSLKIQTGNKDHNLLNKLFLVLAISRSLNKFLGTCSV